MRALILAAGLGWRMGGGEEQPPKCLLAFEGRSLLERHLEALGAVGVTEVIIGVGYQHQLISAELQRLAPEMPVQLVHNPDFREGNIITLWTLREWLTRDEALLLMDADVLYDQRLMQRLVESPHADCFLLDRAIEPGEEPVKLCIRDGRPVEFGKQPDPAVDYDFHGESVGFFRLSATTAARLAVEVQRYLDEERRDAYYEDALRDLLVSAHGAGFRFEDVSGLPWIEIDFPVDVARAEREVLPLLLAASRVI